jgi:hypothetical protein
VEFYATEYLEQNPLGRARLRYNTTSAKKKTSGFGDDFAALHKTWQVLDDGMKAAVISSQDSFTSFLEHLLPGSAAASTWLPLIKHEGWRVNIERMVRIPWGRSTLVASQLTRAFSAHYPDPFFDIMQRVLQWFNAHFANIKAIVDAEDMKFLIAQSTSFNQATLIPLFFPMWKEHFTVKKSGKIEGPLHRLSERALKATIANREEPQFMQLGQPFQFFESTYTTRRPDFLSRLSDQQYTSLFQHLVTLDDRAQFPDWEKIMKESSQVTANVFHSLMKHIVGWIVPGFKIPTPGSADIITYTWKGIVLKSRMLSYRGRPGAASLRWPISFTTPSFDA